MAEKLGLTSESNRVKKSQKGRIAAKEKQKVKRKFRGYSIDMVAFLAYVDRKKRKQKTKNYSNEEVWNDICECFGVDPILARGRAKKPKENVFARQLFCYVCRTKFCRTFQSIGDFIHRDHATAMHSNSIISDGLEMSDPSLMKDWYKYLSNTKIYNK